jgi:hypothetical protein
MTALVLYLHIKHAPAHARVICLAATNLPLPPGCVVSPTVATTVTHRWTGAWRDTAVSATREMLATGQCVVLPAAAACNTIPDNFNDDADDLHYAFVALCARVAHK